MDFIEIESGRPFQAIMLFTVEDCSFMPGKEEHRGRMGFDKLPGIKHGVYIGDLAVLDGHFEFQPTAH